jgi:hypothetical protein
MNNDIICKICCSGGHRSSRCPELSIPLKEGFYRGEGGAQHSHDEDDDEHILISNVVSCDIHYESLEVLNKTLTFQ